MEIHHRTSYHLPGKRLVTQQAMALIKGALGEEKVALDDNKLISE